MGLVPLVDDIVSGNNITPIVPSLPSDALGLQLVGYACLVARSSTKIYKANIYETGLKPKLEPPCWFLDTTIHEWAKEGGSTVHYVFIKNAVRN